VAKGDNISSRDYYMIAMYICFVKYSEKHEKEGELTMPFDSI
jgi:hypothetical protein